MSFMRMPFPFAALVGQERLKKALLLNAVHPGLGGVLIRGEKGTAKSTAARSLAELLPELEVVRDCAFSCDPSQPTRLCPSCLSRLKQEGTLPVERRKIRIVDLPLGATEDRVLGTLDIERAIQDGEKRFEPGLLAKVHRGILYVDEVNLLDDHLVDILLDAAAMGVNQVEREGVSFSHGAQFILVGTMNPEEGDLRPQLLDRFGLCVEVEGLKEPSLRAEVVRRCAAFEKDPIAFTLAWEKPQEELRHLIVEAKNLLTNVTYSDDILELAARISIDMGVDGHRSDIAMVKTAQALAATHLRCEVVEEDIREAAELVLFHRARRKPFQKPQANPDRIDQSIRSQMEKHAGAPPHSHERPAGDPRDPLKKKIR